jgi:hypothetical protein
MGFLSDTKGASMELFHNLKCNVEPYENKVPMWV